MKNECAKTRDVENPYETWVNEGLALSGEC